MLHITKSLSLLTAGLLAVLPTAAGAMGHGGGGHAGGSAGGHSGGGFHAVGGGFHGAPFHGGVPSHGGVSVFHGSNGAALHPSIGRSGPSGFRGGFSAGPYGRAGFAGHPFGFHGYAASHGWGNPWWGRDARWYGWGRGFYYGSHYWWPRWYNGAWAWAAFAPYWVYAPTYGSYGYYWYFCQSADAYYPDVRVCPEGWQYVPAEG